MLSKLSSAARASLSSSRFRKKNILTLLQRALADPERGYGKRNVRVDPDALQHLAFMAGGDARSALNALELAVETTPASDGQIHITLPIAAESIQKRVLRYDKDEDAHYDTISAFIKSVRGSDPMQPFIGWPRCLPPARIHALSYGG